ncbi:MAG TPA: glycosyltransferase [Syntrophales bacterium]|nr:glycosyltransferase [Syntrophales bacterium]
MIAPDYYGLDKSIARAFERNGFETNLVTDRMNLRERIIGKTTRLFHGTKIFLNPLLRSNLKKENQKYISIAKAFKPSFLFVVKGDTIFPETIRYLKKELGIACISYQWDDPFYSFPGATGGHDYRTYNFKNGMNHYDHIFVYDKHYVEEIRGMGMDHVSYLPLAADDELFKKADVTSEEQARYGYDVCFVGMPFKNRIDILNSLNGFNVGVFGDFWERHVDEINGNYYKGKASGETVRKIYCASKIVLNINHPQSKYGVNTRTFEIPSCEAFGIFDYINGIEDLFKIGEEIVCYRDIEELKALIHHYLANQQERSSIAEKGFRRVMQEHTWVHRVKRVIDIVN